MTSKMTSEVEAIKTKFVGLFLVKHVVLYNLFGRKYDGFEVMNQIKSTSTERQEERKKV
jgi:hypothetical protein